MRNTALVLVALVLGCGQDDCIEVGVADEGFHVADDGTELSPTMLPASLAADSIVADDTLLPEALDAWNGWLEDMVLVEALDGETPRVTFTIGFVGTPDWGTSVTDEVEGAEDAEVTHIDYTEDGEIVGAEIVLSSDFSYSRPTMLVALEHGIGHAFFGLADDPGPPTTVELKSIMASPMDPLGVLTAHDRELLLPYLPE